MASDGLSIWLAGAVGDELTTVDPLFGGEADRHRIPVGADAVDLTVSRDAVWVSNGASGTVTRIDPITDRQARRADPHRPLPDRDRGRHARRLGRQLGRRDRHQDRPAREPRRRAPRAGRADPQDIAIGFGSVWVANRGDGTISRIDERTGKPKGKLELGGAPGALAVTTGGLVVLDSARGRVLRVDPRTLKVTDVVRVGGFPSALAVGDRASLWTVDARRGVVTRVSR